MDAYGEIVTNIDDIRQSINIILFTRKMSAPLLPQFGCDLFNYLDEPMAVASPKIIREIRKSLAQWEPRCVIDKISSVSNMDGSTEFEIVWLPLVGSSYGSPSNTVFGITDGNIYLVDEYNRYFLTEFGLLVV